MTTKVYNFSPGPGVLFEEVLTQINDELLNWNNMGISILELNHRSTEFKDLLEKTKDSLRKLAHIPDNFDILFVQGGATQVFSSVPLNFCEQNDTVDYIVNGYWSQFAATEAKKFANVNICNTDSDHYYKCPEQSSLNISPNAKYVHYCANETIHGCEFQYVPDVGGKPLICDMSSNFLSKPIQHIERYGMIYAGSHKNVGPPGMVVVIIRKNMLHRHRIDIPLMLNYTEIHSHNSTLNSPPVFNIYFAYLTFQHILKNGGLNEMQKRNEEKANLLYAMIENSDGFYHYKMDSDCKSKMNVPFSLRNEADEQTFLKEAKSKGLIGLDGHHTVGHCRASLYNAMSKKGVQQLVDFMNIFLRQKTEERPTL